MQKWPGDNRQGADALHRLRWLLLAALTGAPPLAAHVDPLAELDVAAGQTRTLIVVSRQEVLVRITAPRQEAGIASRLALGSPAGPCRGAVLSERTLPRSDARQVDLRFLCADAAPVLRLSDKGLDGGGETAGNWYPDRVNDVLLSAGDARLEVRLARGAATVELPVGMAVWRSGSRLPNHGELPAVPADARRGYFALGVHHVVTGYDHLAFLAGLVLLTPALRQLVVLVTGFTVAHSLSLALGALGLLVPPAAATEAAIAATVALVGLENLLLRTRGRPAGSWRWRWWLTFGFGLIHGFGFAFMLAEVGLPPDRFTGALLAFNLGVETGQLLIAALPLAILLALARWRRRWWHGISLAGSGAVAMLGLYWLFARLALAA